MVGQPGMAKPTMAKPGMAKLGLANMPAMAKPMSGIGRPPQTLTDICTGGLGLTKGGCKGGASEARQGGPSKAPTFQNQLEQGSQKADA